MRRWADAQAYHHGGGSLKAGRSELGGYSQAASVVKDSFMEDDALLKDEDPSAHATLRARDARHRLPRPAPHLLTALHRPLPAPTAHQADVAAVLLDNSSWSALTKSRGL